MSLQEHEEAVSELDRDWLQVRVPLPFSLRWVNSYLIAESGGYTVIDPGLHTSEAAALWERVLKERNIGWEQIRRVLLTHQHPDHYGLAGWFQQRSGAPVFMSRLAHDYAVRMWGEQRSMGEEWTRLFAQHGLPQELLVQLAPHLESFVAQVSPQPQVSYLESGGQLELGGELWELVHTPGHATGHLCLYQRQRRWMLCGDQVLPDITPNVSLIPGDRDRNPLRSFLASLELLAQYEVERALPGHRMPFQEFAQRIDELQRHHARRLAELEQWLAAEPQHAYALCLRMFGQRIGGNIHHLRFALSEILAHLHYLEEEGRIANTETAHHVMMWSKRV